MSDKIIMNCQYCHQPITLEEVANRLLRVFKTCGCRRGLWLMERVEE